jgi:NADH:ubiquinone oxidoreductase subunit D
MEALLKALAEALGPYLPTGGAVETSSDLSPQTIEAVHTAVGEFITAGGIESEIESAVTDEVESQISNNDLISQTDIETLIDHFLSVSWGPVIPPNEVSVGVEATKGVNSYYLISDGGTTSYRTRIRTPTFPHLQMIPKMCRGFMLADLVAIVAGIDFVMADVDR